MKTKIFFAILSLYLFASSLSAQVNGGEYVKLAELYNTGKYERCFFKADDYTYKEDYSKDAEPYLYISMCLLELSKSEDPDIQEDYKGAVKQSIKYAAKFVSKDKKDELYSINIDYIISLKKIQKDVIKKDFYEGSYRKAGSGAKMYNKLNKEKDVLIQYFVGVNEVLSKNLSQGERNMDAAEKLIKEKMLAGELKVDKNMKSLFIDAFMKYTETMINDENKEKAGHVISFAKDIFPNDGYIKVQHNVIYNDKAEK